MNKIPTVFVRDEATNRRYVRDEILSGCEWVTAGEGVATRKFDGSCTLYRDGHLWRRREVRVEYLPDLMRPELFVAPDGTPDRAEYERITANALVAALQSRLGGGVALVPDGFDASGYDPVTQKIVGWLPVSDGPEDAIAREAYDLGKAYGGETFVEGQTYELVGPKINKNPDEFPGHVLIRHGFTKVEGVRPLTFDGLRAWMRATQYEGIVWHHPDGRMAKLKRKDFPKADPA